MSRWRTASTIGLATGAIGVLLSLVPPISSLEDTLGLRVFFQIRGPRVSPPGVVVVSIDDPAATQLNLSTQVREWPRRYHAQLIDRLMDEGASAIAFDLQFFRETTYADDAALANAISRSKRVVLVQMLEELPGGSLHRQDPIPTFAKAAAAVAPVPIPDTPFVSSFWSFLPVSGREIPTLPAVALQIGSTRIGGVLDNAMKRAGVDMPVARARTPDEVLAYMQELRRRFKSNKTTMSQVRSQLRTGPPGDDQDRQLARALAELYGTDGASYLNFYGPPGSLCTVPYEIALEGKVSPCAIKGATVFVGVGRSRLERAEQIDTYHTVYERSDGVDFSGVELHATAFANLLTGTGLRPPSPWMSFAILLGIGILLGGASYGTRTRTRYTPGSVAARLEAAAVATVIGTVYCAATYILFARYYVVVPWITPVTVQLPMALVLGLLVRPTVREERLQAVCLAADASGSTAVGQRLAHDEYAALMMDYGRTLAECVTMRDGLALPPHGDGFVSLWVLGSRIDDNGDASLRLAACQAALQMVAAAGRFNQARTEDERLPVRLGLTLGAVTIRSDADRGAFEAVGDTVNVAARLQQANRDLGTTVLASADVVEGLGEDLRMRHVDMTVALKGVSRVPQLVQLIPAPTGTPT